MLSLLAPSKTLDFTTPLPFDIPASQPALLAQSRQIAAVLKAYDPAAMAKLMHVSPALAASTVRLYQDWSGRAEAGRPALWTYVGDVYKGLRARGLTRDDTDWANQHLLILSGLYGAVRPYDRIEAYRLEMKTKLPVDGSDNLYDFWDSRVAELAINCSETTWCMLSSEEYGRVISAYVPHEVRLVTPAFMDTKPNGQVQSVPIYSKIMRGVMARWIIDHRIDDPEGLIAFQEQGYVYDESRSTADGPVFVRTTPMTPLRFNEQ